MPHVTVNGVRLSYEIEGEGPPLLLIAGLGANRLSWALAVPRLRDAYHCITFDNRGAGQSDAPPGPYTIDQMGDDAAELLAHLGGGPVRCVGWSLGGSVLQSLLIHHPEAVSRAVLLSTLPSYTEVQHQWLDALLALRQANVEPLAQGVVGMPWAFTPRLLADHARAFEAARLGLQNPYPTSYEGFAAQAAAIRVYDSRPHLREVHTPTLVLVGAEDVLTPVSQSVEIAKRLPHGELVVLPRGGHAMLIEYPDETLAEIRRFLAA